MFHNIVTVLLHTIIIDYIFFFCAYIFGNRKKIRQNLKRNWFIVFLFFLVTIWGMSIIFSFWGIGNDTQDRDYFSSDTLFSCYIAILIGALTLYFTIFAFIKPKRMAFANYEKYVLNSTSKILYTTIGISVFINTVSLFFNYKNFFFRLALFESIVYIIVSLIFSIFELNTLENEEKASEIFVKFICSKIQQEKKYKIKKNSNNKKQADISPNVRQYALNLFKNYIVK